MRAIEAHILQPLGMADSFVSDGGNYPAMARGHRPWFGTKRAMAHAGTQRGNAPAGGVIASARDVAKYLAVLMNGRDDIITAEAKAAMLRAASRTSPFYGLGWFLDAERGIAYHTGSTPGVETLATLMPATRKGVVVLVNAGSGIGFGETTQLREGIAARALGLEPPEPDSRWQQKALFLSLALLPVLFLCGMAWAWTHRAALHAKSRAGAFGLFSLWFPLVATLAMAWVLLHLVPQLFSVSLVTLNRFQPDLTLIFAAAAVTGVIWAALRLALAYSGRRASPG